MKLIIAEKPSVAADIAAALNITSKRDGMFESDECIVAAARGHLVQLLPRDNPGWSLEKVPCVPKIWVTTPIKGAEGVLKALRSAVARRDVDEIVNACDAGREGEFIFRLVMEHLRVKKDCTRMWLQTMTKDGIRAAFSERKASASYDSLGNAARARSMADWLIGINLSIVLTRGNLVAEGELVTAGRVQTPTLALVVDREQAITNFVSQSFWEVEVEVSSVNGNWTGKWQGTAEGAKPTTRLASIAAAKAVELRLKDHATSEVKDMVTEERKAAPLLFDLTNLQRQSNTRFGFTAAETLEIAQSLYERHKVTTYPRTNAQHLPSDYVDEAKRVLSMFSGELQLHASRALEAGWVSDRSRLFDDAKVTDHFAIIPTGRVAALSEKERKVFDLICERSIAAFFPPVVTERRVRAAVFGTDTVSATSQRVVDLGWWDVTGDSLQLDEQLKPLIGVAVHRVQSTRLLEGETTPPDRYTEASLLAAMARGGTVVGEDDDGGSSTNAGLGTPATRASIIEGLLSKKREYMRRERKYLVPTFKGCNLVEKLRAYGVDSVTSAATTARWEALLGRVEQGALPASDFQVAIEKQTIAAVKSLSAHIQSGHVDEEKQLAISCRCGAAMYERSTCWFCKSCNVKIWRNVAKQDLEVDLLSQLISGETTRVIDGFRSREGRGFSASLRLGVDGKVAFVFPKG